MCFSGISSKKIYITGEKNVEKQKQEISFSPLIVLEKNKEIFDFLFHYKKKKSFLH